VNTETESIIQSTSQNSSFSSSIPGLQIAIDSTSLGAFKVCPRKYFYSIVMGFQPKQQSIHLAFGLAVHGGLEHYDRERAKGVAHEEAVHSAVKHSLEITWDRGRSAPAFGGDPNKNRLTLIRTIVWYLDQFGESDPLQTLILANGQPAVELSFRFPIGRNAPDNSDYQFCGHLDRIASLNGSNYIVDRKTTKHTLDARFFSQFTPGNQFSMYCLAGQIAFGTDIKGLIVDGAQVAVGFTRFERALVPRDAAGLDEWFGETGFWIGQMESCAAEGRWPMNDKSCDQYGGCEFRSVCSRPPNARARWLELDFAKRVWDPLRIRGDF